MCHVQTKKAIALERNYWYVYQINIKLMLNWVTIHSHYPIINRSCYNVSAIFGDFISYLLLIKDNYVFVIHRTSARASVNLCIQPFHILLHYIQSEDIFSYGDKSEVYRIAMYVLYWVDKKWSAVEVNVSVFSTSSSTFYLT